ncbi:MAG: choice-of-anchor D domain-containing protein, partial [Luteolibacter sp.]
ELDFTGKGPQANNGSSPGPGALYFHSDGRLYGTTSDGGPNYDGTVFRLHFVGAPEIEVDGFNGSSLTDNVGSAAIGPVRLKTPFISDITIRNDGDFPLLVSSITLSRDGSPPGPISLKDVRSVNILGETRWFQFGQLPPTIYPGERVAVLFEIPPSQPGPHSFTISISNNDSDENPFEIHLTADFTFQKDLIVAQPTTHNVLRFDRLSGEPRGAFIAAGAGGLDAPAQMIVGPDAKLYIADSVANAVKRFDLDGNFIDNFTPAGTLTNPVALKFGPDGNLYVLCGGANRQIHRFHGSTGVYEALLVNATSIQLNSAKDFIFMPSTNDFLVTSATNAVARFNFTTGAFVSNYLNPTKNRSILDSPTGITIGPDGNYWVASSSGSAKITRFRVSNAARINDALFEPSSAGIHEIVYDAGYFFMANSSTNKIKIFDAHDYLAPYYDPDYIPNSDSGFDFIQSGSQGLTNPKNILLLGINDPPLANAGADQLTSPGQIVKLTSTGSDPEGLPLTYQWTQLSGTPVLSGSLLASGSVASPSLGFIAPNFGGPLVFQLTVSDGVKSASDTVVVTLSGPPVGSVPVLTLQAASGVTTQSATLHGTVNPVAGNAAYRFEYGTVSLNSATASQTVSSSQAVGATLTGLLPGQTYFYRLIASNGVGGQFTPERSFTTFFEQREVTVESPPSPELSDGSGELDLSKVIYGRSGIARIITIRNAGATDLTLGPITKDGTDAGDFAVSTPATTTLSAGASVDLTVIFTPGALGVRTAAIHIPSNDADEASFDIALTGTGVTPPELWRFQNFGIITNTGIAADSKDPDKDSLINLLERAFNLNPNQATFPILTAGTGTSGLPLIRRTGEPPAFSIQYLRLKASTNPGFTYRPQFSTTLQDGGAGGWADVTGTETVQSIDANWERVTVEESASGLEKRFGRVKVTGEVQ